jgi:hypothetical protein
MSVLLPHSVQPSHVRQPLHYADPALVMSGHQSCWMSHNHNHIGKSQTCNDLGATIERVDNLVHNDG